MLPAVRSLALRAAAATLAAAPVALFAAATPAVAAAQVGATTDIIVGTVTGPTGQPIAGAQVAVTSIETGVTRSKTTDAKGHFTLLFPDGGGQYRVTARFLGYAPQTHAIARQADEDRLVVDFKLSQAATQLSTVTVQESRTARRPNEDERPTPGSQGRTLSGEQLLRLPIDPSDPNAIAALSPGVVSVTGSDTSAAGFSVAGQRPDQNQITLDGLTFEGGGVPQEAVRSTRVVTNTYDVARGQFTGGLVQTTTRGGTNDVAGSLSFALRDPHLEFTGEDEQGAAFQQYTQHQLSGGVGGPIVKDRLFYFGSAQLRRRVNPLQSLLGVDPRTLQRLGTSPDSATRFLSTLGGFGLPVTVGAVPDDRISDNVSAIGRVDYQLAQDHSLTLRGNVQGSQQSGFRTSALTVPSYGGEQSTLGGGGMLSLSSVFGTVLNEVRASASRNENSGDPYLELPAGSVRVSSALDPTTTGAASGVSTLSFGGNPGLPTEGTSTQVEVTDELSLLQFNGHRWKIGGLFDYTGFSSLASSNQYGSFSFNSLADLATNRPAQFTRTLTPRERDGGAVNGAVYVGDTWRRSRSLQLTYGVRAEYSRYLDAPAYNPEVESLFGRRTDRFPADWRVSPRLGFTWTLGMPPQGQGGQGGFGGGFGGRGGGGGGGARGGGGFGGGPGGPGGGRFTVIRGGIGEFRGRAPTQLFSSAVDATGLPGGQLQLVCIGAGVPTPDWPAYLGSPSAIPTTCADPSLRSGQAPPTTQQTPTQRRNVTVFDPAFGAPLAWRASLGVQHRVTDRISGNVDASYALGRSLYGAQDLNLVASPAFTLAAEGNRPVYVPASTIVAGTGATTVLASRQHPQYAQVLDARSNLESRTTQVTASLNGSALRGLIWNLSYTLTRSSDQTSFPAGFGGGGGGGGGGFALGTGASTTAGNPNVVEWGTSDLERRHSFVGSGTWLVRPWLDLTSVLRVTSGTPYTPRVGGDINGDGARNDRAFVFDPAAPGLDTAVTGGMSRLLAGASPNVKDCLLSQLGRVAGRNSCTSAWFPSVDLQANLRPDLKGAIGRRLTLNVSLVNPLAGLDRALHGAGDLRGWGQPNNPNATLLYVRGFDAARQRYVYEVNQLFGDTRGARTAIRNPFQIGVQARFQIGPDRQREMMLGALGRDRNGRRLGAGAGGFDVRAIVERVAPDPIAQILARRDSLALTDKQVVDLQLVSDSLKAKTDSLIARVQAIADSATGAAAGGAAGGAAGAAPAGDFRTVFPRIQPSLQTARDNYLAALKSAQKVLTPQQWQKLPDALRNPRLPQPGRGPGGGGQGRRPGGEG